MTKFGRSGRPQRRWLAVAPGAGAVAYASPRKRAAECTVAFADVDAVLAAVHISHAEEVLRLDRSKRAGGGFTKTAC